jgi:hypothetical protein
MIQNTAHVTELDRIRKGGGKRTIVHAAHFAACDSARIGMATRSECPRHVDTRIRFAAHVPCHECR